MALRRGGKSPLASKIVEVIEKELRPFDMFFDAYCGGCSVLAAMNPEGLNEIANDTNLLLTNFYWILQRDKTRRDLERGLNLTTFNALQWRRSRDRIREWNRVAMPGTAAKMMERPNVRLAMDFFILNRQSMAGRMKNFAPVSTTRLRRGMNEQASAWISAIDGLAEFAARMRRVCVLCEPAVDVMKRLMKTDAVCYIDCPYLAETRASPEAYGAFEMTEDDHLEMLNTVNSLSGRFCISGYPSKLYEKELTSRRGWRKTVFEVPNHASSKKVKPIMAETLWYRR